MARCHSSRASARRDTPIGDFSIAAARLLLHAQGADQQQRVACAFGCLPQEDLATLSFEMALTGIAGATYPNTPEMTGGPAFLVYYAPAFLRRAIDDDIAFSAFADLQRKGTYPEHAHGATLVALRVLAEVYRSARKLFPRSESDAASTVIVHLAAFKNESIFDIASRYQQGQCWLNVRTSANECMVECHSITAIANVLGAPDKGGAFSSGVAALSLWPTQIMAGIPAPAAQLRQQTLENILRKPQQRRKTQAQRMKSQYVATSEQSTYARRAKSHNDMLAEQSTYGRRHLRSQDGVNSEPSEQYGRGSQRGNSIASHQSATYGRPPGSQQEAKAERSMKARQSDYARRQTKESADRVNKPTELWKV